MGKKELITGFKSDMHRLISNLKSWNYLSGFSFLFDTVVLFLVFFLPKISKR